MLRRARNGAVHDAPTAGSDFGVQPHMVYDSASFRRIRGSFEELQ